MRRTITRCGGLLLAAALVVRPGSAEHHPIHEVRVLASRYAYEPATIVVTAGEPVRLVVRSEDGSHGLSIPKLKIDVHVPKSGEPAVVDFVAPPPGQFEIACSEFCGSGHGQMKAALISVAAQTIREMKRR